MDIRIHKIDDILDNKRKYTQNATEIDIIPLHGPTTPACMGPGAAEQHAQVEAERAEELLSKKT